MYIKLNKIKSASSDELDESLSSDELDESLSNDEIFDFPPEELSDNDEMFDFPPEELSDNEEMFNFLPKLSDNDEIFDFSPENLFNNNFSDHLSNDPFLNKNINDLSYNTENNVLDNENTKSIDNSNIEDQILMEILISDRNKYINIPENKKTDVLNVISNIKLDKKIPIKTKPIIYIEITEKDCNICCNEYTNHNRIVECLLCKQHLHQHCLTEWSFESIKQTSQLTCPFCRSEWKHSGKMIYPLIKPF